jgi:hypothetical protein
MWPKLRIYLIVTTIIIANTLPLRANTPLMHKLEQKLINFGLQWYPTLAIDVRHASGRTLCAMSELLVASAIADLICLAVDSLLQEPWKLFANLDAAVDAWITACMSGFAVLWFLHTFPTGSVQ